MFGGGGLSGQIFTQPPQAQSVGVFSAPSYSLCQRHQVTCNVSVCLSRAFENARKARDTELWATTWRGSRILDNIPTRTVGRNVLLLLPLLLLLLLLLIINLNLNFKLNCSDTNFTLVRKACNIEKVGIIEFRNWQHTSDRNRRITHPIEIGYQLMSSGNKKLTQMKLWQTLQFFIEKNASDPSSFTSNTYLHSQPVSFELD